MHPVASRPHFHFTPEKGWINDPLGVTFRNGRYDLYYQYVPDSTVWAPNCHWGHATSPDLVSWTEQGIAVAPGDGEDGIWSGSIAQSGDQTTMFYTAVSVPDFGIGRVRTATPTDDSWNTWEKGDVVVTAPAELDLIAFRDPFVFRDGEHWRMLVGTGLEGGVAAASSFSSPDLSSWTYDGLAAQRAGTETESVWTGTLWECPQIFEIDGRHVLVTSVWEDDVLHYVAYGVGRYEEGKFEAESWGRLTYGDSYYAPSFFRDAEGRPSLVYWMRGVLDEDAERASALSVPHLLALEGDRLVGRFHPDLLAHEIPLAESTALSAHSAHLVKWDVADDAELTLTLAGGDEIRLRGTAVGLAVTYLGSETLIPDARQVSILLDGPAIEITTEAGSFAIGRRVGPAGDVTINGRPSSVSMLER